MKKFALILVALIALAAVTDGQQPGSHNPSAVTIARLKYDGGGNWYWGPSAIPNMHTFLRENTPIEVEDQEVTVTATDPQLFRYPFLYMTGHGNIKFSDDEVAALRTYLENGGFLFANDSYSLAPAFRREIARVFPDKQLVELPFTHPIYHTLFDFPNGLPKIHKHDGKPAQGFAIILDGRVAVFFAFESDIGDGWEDQEVYNDPPEKHLASLRMGANLISYALTH